MGDQQNAPSGIQTAPHLTWGRHLAHFFGSGDELRDLLVPYFKAGLENNERCLWVTGTALNAEDARSALRAAVPDLDRRERDKQIEIADGGQWYAACTKLRPEALVEGLLKREQDALGSGYVGLRTSGDCAWVAEDQWADFLDYEALVQKVVGRRRMICVCSYCMDQRRSHSKVMERHDMEIPGVFGMEQILRSVVENSDDAIITKTLDGIISSWNKSAERIFGYTAAEVIGKPITILIPADREDEEPIILDRLRRGERIDHYETIRQRKDGSLIDISLTVSPIKVRGHVVGASKIARDITERKRNDAHTAYLAGEAEHRAKNILAAVQAVVHLSRSDTADGLRCAIEGRIHALAKVNNLFVQSRWTGAELSMIASQELAPYRADNSARVRIEGPHVVLAPDRAQVIAMTLHELATNAAKYGSLSVPNGEVEIAWSKAADEKLILRWAESGGPVPKKPSHRGFGTSMMTRMIEQSNGSMRFDWRAEGLECEIILSA